MPFALNEAEVKKLWPLWAGIAGLALFVAYRNKQTAAAAAATAAANAAAASASASNAAAQPTDLSGALTNIQATDQAYLTAQGQQLTSSYNATGTAITDQSAALAQLGTDQSSGLTQLANADVNLASQVTSAQQDTDYGNTMMFYEMGQGSPLACLSPGANTASLDPRTKACIDASHNDDFWLAGKYTAGNYASLVTAEQAHYSSCVNSTTGLYDLVCIGKSMVTARGNQPTNGQLGA